MSPKNTFRYILSFILVWNASAASAQTAGPDLKGYFLVNTLFEYATSNKEQFVERFAKNWDRADRAALRKSLARLKALPTYRRDGMIVTFEAEGVKLTVDFSEATKRKVLYVNERKFVMNSYESKRKQVQRLISFARQEARRSPLWSVLLPEAHALPPFVLGALGFVAMGVANKLVDRYGNTVLEAADYYACKTAIEQLGRDWNEMDMCKKYVAGKMAEAKKDPKQDISAAKGALEETTPIETALERCPHEGSGEDKDKVYRGTFFLINEKRRVQIKAQSDGKKYTQVEVREFGTGKVLATYKLNAQEELSEIIVPNTKTDPDKLAEKELSIEAATKVHDPEIAAQQALHRKVFAHFGLRSKVCKAYKAAEDARHQKLEMSSGSGGSSGIR